MILTINGQQVALKKGASIEYVSENRIFTDADDYSMEIELPLAGCSQTWMLRLSSMTLCFRTRTSTNEELW